MKILFFKKTDILLFAYLRIRVQYVINFTYAGLQGVSMTLYETGH